MHEPKRQPSAGDSGLCYPDVPGGGAGGSAGYTHGFPGEDGVVGTNGTDGASGGGVITWQSVGEWLLLGSGDGGNGTSGGYGCGGGGGGNWDQGHSLCWDGGQGAHAGAGGGPGTGGTGGKAGGCSVGLIVTRSQVTVVFSHIVSGIGGTGGWVEPAGRAERADGPAP